DLQHVAAVLLTVDEDLEPAQLLDVFFDLAHAELVQARGKEIVVSARSRHELHAASAQTLDGGHEIGYGERHVLHARAAVIEVEEVDLRCLEEGLRGLVVRELQARMRVPHHNRLEARAADLSLFHVLRVKFDLPEALETHHLLHPRERGLEREEVRRDVIDVGDTEAVGPSAWGVESRHIGHDRRAPLVLHEAKELVAQGGRDVEPGHHAAFDVPSFDARQRRGPTLGQEGERFLGVADVEHDASNALRMAHTSRPPPCGWAGSHWKLSPFEPSGSMSMKRTPSASSALARARCSTSKSGVETATSVKSSLFR